jgi:hypothetical protein
MLDVETRGIKVIIIILMRYLGKNNLSYVLNRRLILLSMGYICKLEIQTTMTLLRHSIVSEVLYFHYDTGAYTWILWLPLSER